MPCLELWGWNRLPGEVVGSLSLEAFKNRGQVALRNLTVGSFPSLLAFAGYTGSHCETDISECSSAPCTSGRCLERSWAARYGHEPELPPPFRHDRAEGYVCVCPPGVRGERC